MREGELEDEWVCLASQNFFPFIDKLSNLRELITDITDQLGGKHGGWETIAVH